MLHDVIVFLNSAKCLFVLHPVHGKESFFKLVGPVLGHQPVWTSDGNVPRQRRTMFRMNLTGVSPETSWQVSPFLLDDGLRSQDAGPERLCAELWTARCRLL